MAAVGVSEAARSLGVSPERVRQMLLAGQLRGERVSGRWIIDEEAVEDLSVRPRPRGRPYSASRAWALLALAAGRVPEWIPERDRRELAAVLARRGVEDLHPRLRNRSENEAWYVHPSMLEDLSSEEGVVVGGADASGRIRSRAPSERYVARSVLPDLVDRYHPDRHAPDHNLVVRVVQGPWPFDPGERVAWPVVVAADLLDHPADARSVSVAREILADA